MKALPPRLDPGDLQRLTDWAELNVLVTDSAIAGADIAKVFEASALILEDDDEQRLEALDRLVEDVFSECSRREMELGDGYPFRVHGDVLRPSGAPVDAYAMLLISDLGHAYPPLKHQIQPDTKSGRLLEKVVEAALRGLFGTAQRFGWPREPGWESGINQRVQMLARQLDRVPDSLDGKTDPADKDRTLDVAALLSLPGSGDGSLVVLAQCAAGENWKSKTGEPSPPAWQNLILWNGPLVRAVALPWRLGSRSSDWSHARASQLFNGAMVFDRPRLLAGHPDSHLDSTVRADIRAWWSGAASLVGDA